MSDNKRQITISDKPPLYQFIISLSIVICVGLLLFSLSIISGVHLFGIDIEFIDNLADAKTEKEIAFLKFVLMAQEIFIFIIPAMIIMYLMKPLNQSMFADLKMPAINEVAIVILFAFCIFPLNSFTGQLNSGMDLPDWLGGLEKWMSDKENSIDRMFELIITGKTFGAMLFNLLMIAVLPAIGEEFIFRGVFQKILYNLIKNNHLAVWMTAFIFSAIHMQFYGFIPRLILGLAFGYLFLWSRTLWLPVIAHFVNNAVPTIGAWLSGPENYSNIVDVPMWKQLLGLPVPIIICTLILIYFRNKSKTVQNIIISES